MASEWHQVVELVLLAYLIYVVAGVSRRLDGLSATVNDLFPEDEVGDDG